LHDYQENPEILHIEAKLLLTRADSLLAGSLDDWEPLKTLAHLAVPLVADWCAVHVLNADGSVARVAIAPRENKFKTPNQQLLNVLQTGEALFVTHEVPGACDGVAVCSSVIVPLKTQFYTIGAITFVMAESGRVMDSSSLAMAESLASKVGVYLDKALRVKQSQALNLKLGEQVEESSVKLRAALVRTKRSEATLRALYRISNQLNSTLNIENILNQLAQEAIRMVGGENGFAGLAADQGMTVQRFFHQGKVEPFEHFWATGQGVPGWVLKHRTTYITNNPTMDPNVDHELSIKQGARSMICTPIINSVGLVLGCFAVINTKKRRGFTSEDQRKLLSLVPVASIAIQNALAFQQRSSDLIKLDSAAQQLRNFAANLESAREQERMSIARDLHDELGQTLTAMKFDLSWLTSHLMKKDLNLASEARTVTDQMDSMVKMVRRICSQLRPGMLDDLGLSASLDWATREFEKSTGIGCQLIVAEDAEADDSLSAASALAVYRIIQEALTNVRRHSKARNVRLSLTTTPQDLVIHIDDDGRGISNDEIIGQKTLGLMGMRERAQRFGGSVSFLGSADGTMVSVIFPRNKVPVEKGQFSSGQRTQITEVM